MARRRNEETMASDTTEVEAKADATASQEAAETKTIEAHAKDFGLTGKAAWKFSAARSYNGWREGKELTRDEFGLGVERAINARAG